MILDKCVLLASKRSSSTVMVTKTVSVPFLTLNNGEKMPIFGLGTWKSKPGEVTQAVCDAIDLGYRHFDCAHCYENEHEVGQALKTKIDEGVVTREQLFITSKLWNTYHKPDMVVPTCKKTLQNLGLEYLDLYLIHWPLAFKEGDNLFPKNEDGRIAFSDVDYVDTWPQMEECVRLGLTKSIGISNFNSIQVDRILSVATIKPVTNQVECHPYLTQRKLAKFCAARDIVITGYSPLGSPDRPWAKPGDLNLLEDPKIKAIADKYKKSVAQVLIRYLIDRDIAVIPKSVNKQRIRENIDVFDFKLSQDDIATLNSFDCNGRLVGCGMDKVDDHPHWSFNIEF
ncbi:hypothetical protein B566_EDAN007595 [Ephemera danica]|nr:hypothetical protein B566_EDAN007595 [Ephemera danica]